MEATPLLSKNVRMNRAIVLAQQDEMSSDDSVIVLGEDVGAAGGVFKATLGLLEAFGDERVRDTPISEMAFLGLGVGAAMSGMRPVVEIMFAEFLGVCLDQLVTEAALVRYLSGGSFNVPLTVRVSGGAGLGFGAQHSQTLETWLMSAPGLKVVVPSDPASAYGLLRASIRDDDPVVFLEPRVLYATRGVVERSETAIVPLGQAAHKSTGDTVTLVGLGSTVPTCIEAAQTLGAGVADVIDLQTLKPWDVGTVQASVNRTGALVIVEESPFTGGWGTDVASRISSLCWSNLRGPVARVACPDTAIPFNHTLEKRFLPSVTNVLAAIDLVDRGQPYPSHGTANV